MIAWLAGEALACDPLGPRIAAARAAVDDAELVAARAELDAAYRSLPCQEARVPTSDLLALYRLDGVVALASDDRARAVYAVLRAAAVDPVGGVVAADDGPELAALFHTYATALADDLVGVSVDDGGTAWVDGRPARLGQPIRVPKGEHFVQIDGSAGLVTSVEDLSSDRVFHTGIPALSAPPPPPPPPPRPAPAPIAAPAPVARRVDVPSRVTWISGLVLGAAGGAALGFGAWSEQQFAGDPYQDAVYGGCARGSSCWDAARTEEIRADANRIRISYAAGYGLAGAGGALLAGGLVGAAVHPRSVVQVGGVW